MNELIQQHLHMAVERMKIQQDKKRSEQSFDFGGLVFLKVKSYVESLVANHSNHKYYGPYKITN
jgi:hypothetical protein